MSQATESSTGDLTYQITFGRTTDTPQLLQARMLSPAGMPPKQLGFNVLTLFHRFDAPVPYRVGSKWTLAINEAGGITLSESK